MACKTPGDAASKITSPSATLFYPFKSGGTESPSLRVALWQAAPDSQELKRAYMEKDGRIVDSQNEAVCLGEEHQI